MVGANIDQTGTNAQEQAISQLLDAAQQGGLNPNEQAQMGQIIQQLNTQEKGANDAVLQNQAARGALTGGETLAAQLANNQGAEANANQLGLGTAANAYNAMLNELTSAGSLGSGLQGQQNTQSNTVNAATNAINQFNASQQQNQENFNTQNANEAQGYNLQNLQDIGNKNVANANTYAGYQAQLPEEVFNNQMTKANAEANAAGNAANLATQQGGQEAGLLGGLAGTAGTVLGSIYGGPAGAAVGNAAGQAVGNSINGQQYDTNQKPNYYNTTGGMAEGGEVENYLKGGSVPGKARVPGNSPKNDTVLAKLSPGEVVLPRTVTQNPSPDHVMAFLNRLRKPKTPHPDDVATVLHALGKVREVNPHAV
jgi:hypothetical protein